jgi:CBS domain containing-hemolysin-like protein
MGLALLLFALGLSLSAFFSGTETGFYRVTRVRLVLDALGGDRVSGWLLWLTNHSTLFVATALIGNNLANNLVTHAVVLGSARLFTTSSHLPEFLASLLLTPVVFVYGELLPKSLYFQAPNRLFRAGGPLLLFFAILFFIPSTLLWLLSLLLERLSGEPLEQVRTKLARRELLDMFEEGHEAGVLRTSQRRLAQGLLAVANRPVSQFTVPTARIALATLDMDKAEILRLARRYNLNEIPVQKGQAAEGFAGYVRVVDLALSESPSVGPVRRLMELSAQESHLAALKLMHNAGQDIARVTDAQGRTMGFVTARALSEPLFRGDR